MKKIIYIAFLSLFIFNCENDSEDDLIDIPEPVGEKVTYNDDVKSIIDNNCIFCHSNPPVNGASTSLITFNDLVNGVNNNNLINRISAQAGEAGAMPLGGPRLPQVAIDLIVQWQTDGLLESN